MIRRALPLVLVLLALTACGGGEQAYFPPSTSTVSASIPVGLGDTGVIGILRIEAKPGDTIVLTEARPLDLAGQATVTPSVVLMSETGGGGVGAMAASAAIEDGRTIADLLHPLDGFTLTKDTGVVQVVLGVSFDGPGSARWTRTELAYTVNGRQMHQAWTFGGLVCSGDPIPTSCPGEDGATPT